MKAFVSGGDGFVCSHLTDGLIADGHDVVVFDNFSTGRTFNVLEAMREHGIKRLKEAPP